MTTIKNQASHSVFWSAVERFSTQGIQFVLGMIIARFLLPSDYGMIAMLSIFMAIAQTVIDGGFINALIQKKECSHQENVDMDHVYIDGTKITANANKYSWVRSEERRVGKECFRLCRSRWSPYH